MTGPIADIGPTCIFKFALSVSKFDNPSYMFGNHVLDFKGFTRPIMWIGSGLFLRPCAAVPQTVLVSRIANLVRTALPAT